MDTYDDGRVRGSGAVTERAWPEAADHARRHRERPVRSILTHRDPGWAEHANLFVNPIGDRVFEDHARRMAATSDDPQGLQARLRQHFPHAVVRRRELSGEPFEMWYVYRDGHWAPAEPPSARQDRDDA